MRKDLKDVTFIIPIKIDSDDRRRNLKITLSYLQRNFDTNIIICESDKESNEEFIRSCCIDPITYIFDKDDSGIFHRTRILNEMTEASTTNIVVNYDIDVVFPIQQYISARQSIKDGSFTIIFPYSGPFYDIKKEFFNLIDNDEVEKIDIKQNQMLHPKSVGGAFFFNREHYRKAGLENENFLSWGFEDNERIVRLQKLGHNLGRILGNCYHLTHYRDKNGWFSNPYIKENESELEKIKNMNKLEIMKYIKTWKWIEKLN